MWMPSRADLEQSHLALFKTRIEKKFGLNFIDYEALWAWSVKDFEVFWQE